MACIQLSAGRVSSIATLQVGPDQPYPRPDPNPYPNPYPHPNSEPCGGLEVGRGSHAAPPSSFGGGFIKRRRGRPNDPPLPIIRAASSTNFVQAAPAHRSSCELLYPGRGQPRILLGLTSWVQLSVSSFWGTNSSYCCPQRLL